LSRCWESNLDFPIDRQLSLSYSSLIGNRMSHKFFIFKYIFKWNVDFGHCWCTHRSISADWSQPTLHYAVGFQDMISDNRIYTFKCTFIYFIIRIVVLKTNTQSLAFAVSIKIRNTNNYIECPFSIGSRIETKTCDKTLTENVSECELKLERAMIRIDWPFIPP